MRYIICSLFLLIAANSWATPSRYVDGRIQFAVATVDGKLAWSTVERDLMTVGTSVVVALTPSLIELNTSSLTAIKNYSDYQNLQSRNGLQSLMLNLYMNSLLCADLGDATCVKQIDTKYQILKAYYQTLP